MSDSKKKQSTSANAAAAAELAAKNLAQIQKIDPCASKILDKVSHTALYKFQKDKSAWEKTDVDGTMFIYQRVDRPFFSLMIANRQSPNDYIEPIVATLKINNDNQYLFFCKSDGTINGLWFYNRKDCSRIAALVEKLIDRLKKSTNSENIAPIAAAPVNSNSSSSSSAPAQITTPSVPATTDTRSAQLLELIKGGQHNNLKPENQSPQKSVAESTSATTPSSSTKAPPARQTSSSRINDVTSTMPVLLQKLMVQEQPRNLLKEPGTAMSADELEKDLLRTAKPRNAQLTDFINSPSAVSLAAFSTRSVHGSEGDVADITDVGESDVPMDAPEPSFVVGSSGTQTPTLNKEQFVMALLNLMQTDDQFVAQIHQAYIDALNRRFGLDNS